MWILAVLPPAMPALLTFEESRRRFVSRASLLDSVPRLLMPAVVTDHVFGSRLAFEVRAFFGLDDLRVALFFGADELGGFLFVFLYRILAVVVRTDHLRPHGLHHGATVVAELHVLG